MSQELFSAIGATGTIHGTHNGGANSNITMLIALEPAPLGTPTPTPTSTPTPTPPPAGITLRAAAIGNNGAGGSTLTIGLPAGTQSGDVMVAHVIVRTANNTITPPATDKMSLRQNTTPTIFTAADVH